MSTFLESLIVQQDAADYVPGFARFGPQYRIVDPTGEVATFIISTPAVGLMDRSTIVGWDKKEGIWPLGRRTKHHEGFCETNGGNALTYEQFEALNRALRVTGTYTPLPGMQTGCFCSSSVPPEGPDHEYYFYQGEVFSPVRRGNTFYIAVCAR